MRPLDDSNLITLRSMLARLIPEEADFAGAVSAGVEGFLLSLWENEAAGEFPSVRAGLEEVERKSRANFSGEPFSQLSPLEQDDLLHEIENGRPESGALDLPLFFRRMVEWTHEGFYANPANGGNRDGVSWRAIGYDPRSPLPDTRAQGIQKIFPAEATGGQARE